VKQHLTGERALLVGLLHRQVTRAELEDQLQELEALVRSAGADVVGVYWQERPTPDAATYIGRGKVAELATIIEQQHVSTVVFDQELTPAQVRNLERIWNVKVLDRAGVILHIFAERARTQEAKVQVELAQLQYLLPRLSRLWTHLSKQVGGIGTRGPGETQLETDRRLIRQRIQRLQRKLHEITQQRQQRRRGREELPRFALVGYTNAGKSTLMRLITKAPVLVDDRLFATLDTTTRRVVLNGIPFLLSDTVGFIRKLPPKLLQAFHTTLAEVREADLLLLVVDASSPGYIEQIRTVERTLEAIGAGDIPVILVMNKMDRLPPDQRELVEESWRAQSPYPTVFISATKKENIDVLYRMIVETLQALPRFRERIRSSRQE